MASILRTERDSTEIRIAKAIAFAEGWFPGSFSWRHNNPGNLVGSDGVKKTYATLEEGWQALYHQVRLMLQGGSRFYNSNMSIMEVAIIYTGGDNPEAWARNVARKLGVGTDTQIGSV